MNMDLRDVEYFAVVAQHGHLGRAAEALGLGQPALSMSLRRLEKSAQAKLVKRTPKGVELIIPVALPNGASVQFNGSHAADRLTLDSSWSHFTGSLTFNGNLVCSRSRETSEIARQTTEILRFRLQTEWWP